MRNFAWRLGITLGLTFFGFQCSPGQLSSGKPEGALDLFGMELQKGNLQQACDNLAWACENNLNGALSCLAKDLLCGATVEETCAKLHLTCATLLASCTIHHDHCLNCGDGICMAGEDCGGCPADCGACPDPIECSGGNCGVPDPTECSGGNCSVPDPTECPDGNCGVPDSTECPDGNCGVPVAPTCDDGVCAKGEDCGGCPADCGPCPTPEIRGYCEGGMSGSGGGAYFNWMPLYCTADKECQDNAGAQQRNLTHCYQGPAPEGGQMVGCVGCAEDSHCKVGPRTTGKCMLPGNSTEYYLDFSCLRCDADADCQGTDLGPRCNTDRQLCTHCLEDQDCVKGDKNTGKCRLVQGSSGLQYGSCQLCTANADCQGTGLGDLCDTATGSCVDCLADSDCVAAQSGTTFCRSGSCNGCTQDSDCQTAGMGEACVLP